MHDQLPSYPLLATFTQFAVGLAVFHTNTMPCYISRIRDLGGRFGMGISKRWMLTA